jgi:long-chain acyl-CoA synthetase
MLRFSKSNQTIAQPIASVKDHVTAQTTVNPSEVISGYTLLSLLDEACDRTPNPQAFNQWTESGWRSLSNQDFQTAVETTALGLLELGLEKGDRIALLMNSGVNFCLLDLASLLATLVNVPIDLTQTIEHILFVLRHSEAKALVVSNVELLQQLAPYLERVSHLKYIIVEETNPKETNKLNFDSLRFSVPLASYSQPNQSQPEQNLVDPEVVCLEVPKLLHPTHTHFFSKLPPSVQVVALEEIQQRGQSAYSTLQLQQLRATVTPADLATLVYIPDETGQMQGVMLTHENLAANALNAFAVYPDLQRGVEVALSFLPLNHVLARVLLYGHINYGHSIYFTTPNRLAKHLQEIRPTILITVPLLLEKFYNKILERGRKVSWIARLVFDWVLGLVKHYELGQQPRGLFALQLQLADRLVLSKWRSLFGNRLKYIICGGAALKPEIANGFAAAGVTIFQGYGLTQASAVVCCNRHGYNRAGTVGLPIPGVEVAIAADGEILVRSPYVTSGYYKNPIATQTILDERGWLHTGDMGTLTADGFLQITGLKKALFKLSTGKYIAPHPLEQRLIQSSFVTQAIALGEGRKFCTLLIVLHLESLHRYALDHSLDLPLDALLHHPCITALYQSLVSAANCHLPYWAIVKRFHLLQSSFTVDNGLLTTTGQFSRAQIATVFAREINDLYEESPPPTAISVACPVLPQPSCPAIAQSLDLRLRHLGTFIVYLSLTLSHHLQNLHHLQMN